MDRAFLEKFMGQTLNVTITDQRQFVGTLVCTDKDRNLILDDTTEIQTLDKYARNLGTVVLPGEHIVSIKARPVTQLSAMYAMYDGTTPL